MVSAMVAGFGTATIFMAFLITGSTAADPAETWTEHWFEHNQVLQRKFFDNDVAVYYDKDVSTSITWPFTFLAQVWKYTKQKYGSFGSDTRLYAVFHSAKYSGGHPSTYFDASHDYFNVIDCGLSAKDAWTDPTETNIPTHEAGHVVEFASKNVKGSPAFRIWGDSKWMEIYIYDVYLGIGRKSEADKYFESVLKTSDNFPRASTFWFRDWFYPIYSQLGNSDSLNKFFDLLSKNFPQKDSTDGKINYKEYSREMNHGEFVHFYSGATGIDLTALALTAFGNKDRNGNDWIAQLQQSRIDFPNVSYLKDITSQAKLTVSKDNGSGAEAVEGSLKMVDSLFNTKFFVFGVSNGFWIKLNFPTAQIVRGYTLTSADDAQDRDIKSWTLSGSSDDVTYDQLDSRSNEVFNGRQLTKKFTFNNSKAYKYYKLILTSTNGSPDFQLAEFRLVQ